MMVCRVILLLLITQTAIGSKLLTNDQIQNTCSRYLSGGIRDDIFEIVPGQFQMDRYTAQVKFNMVKYFAPDTNEDGRFHLSSFKALEMVSQVAIIHIHQILGLKKKELEVWKSNETTTFLRKIKNPENIELTINLKNLKISKGRTFFIYDYSFNNGAFIGRVTLFLDGEFSFI